MLLRYVALNPNCYSNTYRGTCLTCDAEEDMPVADDVGLGTSLSNPVELSIEPTQHKPITNLCISDTLANALTFYTIAFK